MSKTSNRLFKIYLQFFSRNNSYIQEIPEGRKVLQHDEFRLVSLIIQPIKSVHKFIYNIVISLFKEDICLIDIQQTAVCIPLSERLSQKAHSAWPLGSQDHLSQKSVSETKSPIFYIDILYFSMFASQILTKLQIAFLY